MKKISHLFMVTIFFMSLSVASFAHTEANPFVTDLLAGQTYDVGDVLVWNDGTNLHVQFVITHPDWSLTQTHLHVVTNINDIPQKNGNPIPGQFDYQTQKLDTSHDYVIPLSWGTGTNLIIAAHADVCTNSGFSSNADAFIATLPDTATVNVIRRKLISYFQTTITNGDWLNAIYDGWCIDTDRSIGLNLDYCAYVFSSYEMLPFGLIEYPDNLDLVNWLINQDFVGKDYPGNPMEQFTMGDVQFAIWELIEDFVPYGSAGDMGPWSHEKVNYLVSAAYANGEGFVPGCIPPQNRMLVLLVPYDCGTYDFPIAQLTFIPIPVPCVPEDCETAWGDGDDFPGKKWATYITYTIQ